MGERHVTLRQAGDVLVYLGQLALAMAAVGVVLRFTVIRPFKHWIAEQLREPVGQIAVLSAEMQPDHGSSLRDAVDRVEVALSSHVADHEAHGRG